MIDMLKMILGFIALVFGAVGIFVPILPTTPFVLLAVGCFSCNHSIQKKILSIPFVAEYYESYTQRKRLTKKTLICTLVFLWTMLGISAVLMSSLRLTVLLGFIGIGVSIHVIIMAQRR
ncbi:MAG: YbaN family protein [Spirochaetales bacterium]